VPSYSIGILVALGLIAVIWIAFVAPSERRYHEKKLQLLQDRIEKRRVFLEGEGPEMKDEYIATSDGDDKTGR